MIGDKVFFRSSIRSPHNFSNPGAFDYVRYMKLNRIWGNAYTDAKKVEILDSEVSDIRIGFLRKIETARIKFFRYINSLPYDQKAKSVMISLIIGERHMLSDEIREGFSKAGISHLLAISGLHLSIVAAWFFAVFYRLAWFICPRPESGAARKWAAMLTCIPLLGYALFSGFSPSTQRALIMAGVLMVSVLSEKETDVFSSLCTAGILILLVDSAALFSISFQLSFSAVACIMAGIFVLRQYNLMNTGGLKGRCILAVLVTCFAGMGTLPLAAHYFHIVSHIQLFSNVLAIPVTGFFLLPAGFAALFLYQWMPAAAAFILKIACGLLAHGIELVDRLISLPGTWSVSADLSVHEILMIYALLLAVVLAFRRFYKPAVVLVCLCLPLFFLWPEEGGPFKDMASNLNISILDVGQGSSCVIETPDQKVLLIDGGGFPGSTSFDTGRYIVAPFLWRQHIKNIDYIILSHPESDHMNGLVFIAKNFKVGALIKNRDTSSFKAYKTLMAVCARRKIQVLYAEQIEKPFEIGRCVLHFFPSSEDADHVGQNNNSVVCRLVMDKFSILFPGDILKHREGSLSRLDHGALRSDVLLSPHHGSISSSTKVFLDKVTPKSVVISCGWRNRYGFPNPVVLKRYQKTGARIYRTDTNGMVRISSNGFSFDINTWKGG